MLHCVNRTAGSFPQRLEVCCVVIVLEHAKPFDAIIRDDKAAESAQLDQKM